jgi:hypothetical protein
MCHSGPGILIDIMIIRNSSFLNIEIRISVTVLQTVILPLSQSDYEAYQIGLFLGGIGG